MYMIKEGREMRRVYIAGAISAPNLLQALDNIRRGVRVANSCLEAGYAVFVSHIDFQLFLGLNDGQTISEETIKAQSMAWLEVSDAVVLVAGWKNSKGTKKELEHADRLGIPVYYDLEELREKMPA